MSNTSKYEKFDQINLDHGKISKKYLSQDHFNVYLVLLNKLYKEWKQKLDHHWKYNAIHWATYIHSNLNKTIFSYAMAISNSNFYKSKTINGAKPNDVFVPVSSYIDNAVVNLHSCRDKVALMLWSYNTPFNPEIKSEVLTYSQIIDMFKKPSCFGYGFERNEYALDSLKHLNGIEAINQLEKFRHFKIHRWEPRIEIFGVKFHHGIDYTFVDRNGENYRKRLNEEIWSFDDLIHWLDCYIKATVISMIKAIEYMLEDSKEII